MESAQTIVDETYAKTTSFGTTILRAEENARPDRIINDPFAEPLSREALASLSKSDFDSPLKHQGMTDLVAIRTRYLDEALNARNPNILQIVLLGAGLDSRAYRLDSLCDCHVLEMDQGDVAFDHKRRMMKELGASPVATKVDYITADLSRDGWETKLAQHGFDPSVPTFWAMEGLLPYLDRESNLALLNTIDMLSAPGSELWADMAGHAVMEAAQLRSRIMKFGEDNPLEGIFSQFSWKSEIQASLGSVATHFGREWMPLKTTDNQNVLPYFLVTSRKPE